MKWLVLIIVCFSSLNVYADFAHERVKRITVFPLKVEKELEKPAESVWWDLREKLTDTKRFLVASKNFMQAKDVFQARGDLEPADAIILGRLLDAQALVTTFVVERRVSMRVYETKNGLTLWRGDIDLHPAILASKQLPDACNKLLFDFVAAIPYQGAVIIDSLIGRPMFSQGEKWYLKADVGAGTQVTTGDTAQLFNVRPTGLRPLFQEGSSLEVFAEGKVVNVDRQIITVEITRRQPDIEIHEDALVRIPDELRRLREIYGLHESAEKNIALETLRVEDEELTPKQKETKPLVTSLSWIGNLALILMLAF